MSRPKLQYCKTPLPLDQYDQYEISQYYSAYIIEFSDVSLDRCDYIEQQLQYDGFKIFHTDTSAKGSSYNITFIVGSSEPILQSTISKTNN